MPTRYALLVGVDHYLNDGSRRCKGDKVVSLANLRGCVNDVESFKTLLQDIFNFDEICTLLSQLPGENPDTHGTSSLDSLPTFDTIKREFTAIESKIQPGDLFFFHFSGHGALLNIVSKSPQGREKDPSLMTADYCCGKPALRGWQLNNWLRRINKKGAQVVVSLDSCYSGGAWRGDAIGFRTPDQWPSVPNLPIDEEAAQQSKEDDYEIVEAVTRDAELETSWSINPRDFTLMTACETRQKAGEIIHNGKAGGAFTCELLEYLKDSKYQVSYRMARDHLQARLDPQRPTCHGRDRFYFFGKSEPFNNTTPLQVQIDNGRMYINAGRAHGICEKSEFVLFPTTSIHTISISEVEEFKSSARISKVVEDALGRQKTKMVIPSRWCLGEGKVLHVRVDTDFGEDVPSKLREMLESRIVNIIKVNEDPEDGKNTMFKILRDGAGIKIFGPESVIGYREAVRALKVGRVTADTKPEVTAAEIAAPLVHLARFGHILNLKPTDPEEPHPFTVSVTPDTGASAEGPWPTGQRFTYKFENTSDQYLYIAILNLTPEFKIRQLVPVNDAQVSVPPNGLKKYKFRINLPDDVPPEIEHEIHRSNRRDIIRTLVSTETCVSWKTLELPKIWEADKMDLPKSQRVLRDAAMESMEAWWVRDDYIVTTDFNYTAPDAI